MHNDISRWKRKSLTLMSSIPQSAVTSQHKIYTVRISRSMPSTSNTSKWRVAMYRTTIATLLTISSLHISTSHAIPTDTSQLALTNQNNLPTPDVPYTFRRAERSDIRDITDVLVDAFNPSPLWHYGYQFKDKYPIYHRECIRQGIEQQWDRIHDYNDTLFFNVIDVPILPPSLPLSSPSATNDHTPTTSPTETSRVVSIALWRIIPPPSSQSPTIHFQPPFLPLRPQFSTLSRIWKNCSLSLSTNKTRMSSYETQFHHLSQKYVTHAYPNTSQIYLQLLATHPSYDGHNFGARQVRRGMDFARDRDRKELVTLIATPVGYPPYKGLGFGSVVNVSIEMLDGLGRLWWEVMRWKGD